MSGWLNLEINPIPLWGKNGKEFKLRLSFEEYYGYKPCRKHDEIVTAIWDSTNECFFEKNTKLPIRDEDIFEWWKED